MKLTSLPCLAAFQGYVSLIVAVVLGVLASAPVIYSRVRYFAETTYILGARPADDTQLKVWAISQPEVVAFTTERRGEDLWIRSEYLKSISQRPSTPELAARMRQLGYEFRGDARRLDGHGEMSGICLIGVCLAWLYQRTGSLLAPITAHIVNNGLAILRMVL